MDDIGWNRAIYDMLEKSLEFLRNFEIGKDTRSFVYSYKVNFGIDFHQNYVTEQKIIHALNVMQCMAGYNQNNCNENGCVTRIR